MSCLFSSPVSFRSFARVPASSLMHKFAASKLLTCAAMGKDRMAGVVNDGKIRKSLSMLSINRTGDGSRKHFFFSFGKRTDKICS